MDIFGEEKIVLPLSGFNSQTGQPILWLLYWLSYPGWLGQYEKLIYEPCLHEEKFMDHYFSLLEKTLLHTPDCSLGGLERVQKCSLLSVTGVAEKGRGTCRKLKLQQKWRLAHDSKCLHVCWLNFRGREACWRIYHLLFFPLEYSELPFTVGVFSSASASYIMCINNVAGRRSCHVCVCVRACVRVCVGAGAGVCTCMGVCQLLHRKIVSFQKFVSGKLYTSQW